MRDWARPRLCAPGVATLAAIGSCYVISRTTGAGWVVVIGCVLLAALVTGVVQPWWSLRHIRLALTGPPDGLAGAPLGMTLTVTGASAPLVVTPTDPTAGPVLVAAPTAGTVTVVPVRRGLLQAVTLDVSCSGPFGFVTWSALRRVPLPAPVAVAPHPRPGPAPVPEGLTTGTAFRTRPGDGDLTRGAREYRDGEPIRLVHWPATARTGTVMVRETETETAPRLRAVVDLRGDPDLAEAVAGWAAAVLPALLAAGTEVELGTCEADGPCLAPVRNRREVGRRLARAVPGVPAPGAPAGSLDDAAVLRFTVATLPDRLGNPGTR